MANPDFQLPPEERMGAYLDRLDLKAKVYELRLVGKSFREIGDELGLTANVAALTFKNHLAQLSKVTVLEMKEQRFFEVERIERMMDVVYPRALSGDLDAVKVALLLMSRKAKFLGLDAPIKMSHKVKAEVSRSEDIQELTAQTQALFEKLRSMKGIAENKTLDDVKREVRELKKPIDAEFYTEAE